VYAVTALHNFLNSHIDPASISTEANGDAEEDSGASINHGKEQGLGVGSAVDREAVKCRRDAVAEEVWEDYQEYHARFG
jgi:hypothetical protein